MSLPEKSGEIGDDGASACEPTDEPEAGEEKKVRAGEARVGVFGSSAP
jgi:hypothetical protein